MDLRSAIAKTLAVAAMVAGLCCHALPAMAHGDAAVARPAVSGDCASHSGEASGHDADARPRCCVDAPADAATSVVSAVAPASVGVPHAPMPALAASGRVAGRCPAKATGPPAANRALAKLGAYRS